MFTFVRQPADGCGGALYPSDSCSALLPLLHNRKSEDSWEGFLMNRLYDTGLLPTADAAPSVWYRL
jgi:hypothetical protein